METLHGDAQNFGGRKKRQYTEFVNRPNSVNGLNGFELGLNGLNGLNGLRLPGLRPVLWGPLIPTRLRRGWTCFAGPALATPDEHRLYAGPDELDMIEASSFFVTCEHSSKFYALRGLWRYGHVFGIAIGALFFRNSGERMETEKCLLVTKRAG